MAMCVTGTVRHDYRGSQIPESTKLKESSIPVLKARRPLVDLWVRQVWVKVFCKFKDSHSRKVKTVATAYIVTLD